MATRLTLLTLIFFLISIWAIMAYVSRILHEDLQRVLGSQQFSTTSYIAATVNNELNDRLNALNVVAKQISSTVLGNTGALQTLIEQRPILASLFTGSVWVSRQDGIAIASLMPELIGTNYADRDYLITVLKEGKAAISKPITGKVMKDAIFVMAAPIRDELGKVMGALAGVVDLGRPNFLDKFTEAHYGKTGNYFIVDPQNRIVITSTDKSRVMQQLPAPGVNPMIDRFVQGYEGSAVLVNAVGKEVLSSSKLIPLTGWAVSISLSTEDAFAPIHNVKQRLQIITIILTFLGGCLIWLVVSRTLQRQLSPMLVASRMLATMCDTDQPPQLLPVTSQDEIGELIGGFNRLLDTLGKREQALIRSENELKKTQHIAQLGSWYLDLATNQVVWTEELYKMYGFDPLLPPPPYPEHQRMFTSESWETLSYALAKMRDTGIPYELELETVREDEHNGWMWVRGEAVFDEGGEIVGIWGAAQDITARKRAEENQRESEARYRMLFEDAYDGIGLADMETGQLVDCNQALCRMVARDKAELVGKPQSVLHPPTEIDTDNLSQTFRQHREGNLQQGLEDHLLSKSGKILTVDIRASRIQIGGREFLLGIFRDITDRKRTEDALKENVQRLELAQNAAHAGIWDWDVVNGQIKWSSQMFNLFGLDKQKSIASFEAWRSALHPEDLEIAGQRIDKALKERIQLNSDYRILLPSGQMRWINAVGKAEYDVQGRPVRMIGVCIDITERKQAEQNYQMLFHKMLDGFALHEIICDFQGCPADYRFLAVNPAFERMTGLKADEITGRTALEVLPGLERKWIETYGEVALSGEPVFFTNYSTEFNKYFEVTAFRPLPNQFACIFQDVTERKNAEEESNNLQKRLQQAQKMEAIGTLAGGIAHDFNNILGAILGYAEMVQEDSQAGSRSRGDIDQVVNASHRAKELVKQILNFSRQAATEQIPLQPALIIKEAVKMLRSSLPSTIDLQQDIDPDVGLISADPTQIHQVLMNLCTNAFHSMEETGGTLTLSLKRKTLSKVDLASEPQVQPGDFVQLSVSDTGSGIAPDIQEKMFDPFFTTKEVGKGTGMGLAIIHGIAKSSKGFVSFHSQPDEGTVFHVYLPVIADTPVEIETAPPLDLTQLGNERILFIDDEEILAEMGQAMLERLGYRVTVRRNSIDALSTFQNKPDHFDLVITDQTMPGMTGIDLARRMLQIRPGMPIILCTGYSTLVSEEKAKLLGIKGFAMKPLAKKEIAEIIRQVFDGGKPLS